MGRLRLRIVHIVDGVAYPEESSAVQALCGAACIAWGDGTTTPEDFDWYLLNDGHEHATCAECRAHIVDTHIIAGGEPQP